MAIFGFANNGIDLFGVELRDGLQTLAQNLWICVTEGTTVIVPRSGLVRGDDLQTRKRRVTRAFALSTVGMPNVVSEPLFKLVRLNLGSEGRSPEFQRFLHRKSDTLK